MSQQDFVCRIGGIAAAIAGMPLDKTLEQELDRRFIDSGE